MSNKDKRFFGRKSVSRLTQESTSSLNVDENENVDEVYNLQNPPIIQFPDPVDLLIHATLARNPKTHISHCVYMDIRLLEVICVSHTLLSLTLHLKVFTSLLFQLFPIWITHGASYGIVTSQGMHVAIPIPHVDQSYFPNLVPDFDTPYEATLKAQYVESQLMMHGMRDSVMTTTDEYYHYLVAEREEKKKTHNRVAELEVQVPELTLQESQRASKSKKRQAGEGSSGS